MKMTTQQRQQQQHKDWPVIARQEPKSMPSYKTCSCCGSDAGRYEQHANRDTGFGICRRCVDWLIGRGMTAAELLNLYGVEGVHYAAKGE